MKTLVKAIVATACVIALSSTRASAEIVCNDDGDCWHTKTKHEYKPEFKVRVFPDDWKWSESEGKKYKWREHDGRGYWRQGVWIEF